MLKETTERAEMLGNDPQGLRSTSTLTALTLTLTKTYRFKGYGNSLCSGFVGQGSDS